jgi:hypothetical protein
VKKSSVNSLRSYFFCALDFWKKIGVSTQIRNFPQRLLTSEEYRNGCSGLGKLRPSQG